MVFSVGAMDFSWLQCASLSQQCTHGQLQVDVLFFGKQHNVNRVDQCWTPDPLWQQKLDSLYSAQIPTGYGASA